MGFGYPFPVSTRGSSTLTDALVTSYYHEDHFIQFYYVIYPDIHKLGQ